MQRVMPDCRPSPSALCARRCVETLTVRGLRSRVHAELSPLLVGAFILTQASSIRDIQLYLGTAITGGVVSIILVRSQNATASIRNWQLT